MSAAPEKRAVVIGAGAVGMSCAVHLQRDGWRVTVLDPLGPGEAASFGNAGVIAVDSIEPVATPGILLRVPNMLLDPLGPLAVRWGYLPWLAPWLWRFVRASNPKRVEQIAAALATLMPLALSAHLDQLGDARGNALIQRNGWLRLYRTVEGWQRGQGKLALLRRHGIKFDALDNDEMRQIEPALSRDLFRAVHVAKVAHTVDPRALVVALAEIVAAGGGELRRETVRGLEPAGDGAIDVVTDAGRHRIGPEDCLVIAAGAWSRPLAAQLGSKVPLDTERGYHVMFRDAGDLLRRPVIDAGTGVAVTPMTEGLRVGGTVELGGLKAAPNYRRLDRIVQGAEALIPALAERARDADSRWMGFRPSLPDSLPVIGRSPRYHQALFAFGHGHVGLSLAAITGRLIAQLAGGRPPPVDLTPFRPDRF